MYTGKLGGLRGGGCAKRFSIPNSANQLFHPEHRETKNYHNVLQTKT